MNAPNRPQWHYFEPNDWHYAIISTTGSTREVKIKRSSAGRYYVTARGITRKGKGTPQVLTRPGFYLNTVEAAKLWVEQTLNPTGAISKPIRERT